MNKKFLSAILFGALMVTSTGTFVSCKDYDDDIDAINKELTDVKSQIAALQAKVDAGKWITSVSSNAAGVTINLSDGSSVNITNGKDGQNGAQGEAGKDGKDGSVVEVKDGVLYINGEATEIKVAEEAPAALPCVKVENGELLVLNAEGEYVASGIKACSVVAVKENGVWTITTADGESIVVPGAAALTSIEIQKAPATFTYYYGVVKTAKEWGWNKEETMPAGFYTKLGQNVNVLLNPAEADGTMFTYTFKNSLGAAADVDFFEEARPAENVALTRATSKNGLWTLPAKVTAKPASESESLRRELYLNFKENDGSPYLLTLEATDLLGNVAVRSNYEYAIELAAAPSNGAVYAPNNGYCLIGETYYPEVTGAVYDYKIRVNKAYERLANVYGITTDGKSFSASSEAAIYNHVVFDYALVRLNGTSTTGSFTVYFTNEMISTSNAIQAEALNAPLDATLIKDADKVYRSLFKFNTTYKSELSIEELDATAKMLWAQAIDEGTYSAELIGGETQTGDNNYNEVAVNTYLKNNAISWGITYDSKKDKYYLEADFYVDPRFDYNFQLETAYQLNVVVNDPENNNITVATVELPFEFDQPTLDINQVNGEFTEWSTIDLLKKDKDGKYYISRERALYVYGPKSIINNWDDMFLPLYDSFTAWQPESATVAEFEKYLANAKYYNLNVQAIAGGRILSAIDPQAAGTWYEKTLDNDLAYTAVFTQLNTWMQQKYIKEAATNGLEGAATNVLTTFAADGETPIAKPYELSTPVEVSYKHYGVYLVEGTEEEDEDGDVVKFNKVVDNDDFNLVFASWLNHSEMEMKEASYSTERGSHIVFLTNDDLNFTTPKGDAFYLFDDISATGSVVKRADKNTSFNEIQQHPFTTVSELFVDANFKAKQAAGSQAKVDVTVNTATIAGDWFVLNPLTGVSTLNAEKFNEAVDQDKVQIYNVPSYPLTKVSTDQVVSGVAQAFQGGMVIQLPKSIQDGQSVIVTVTVADKWGYTKSVDITVKKL